MGTVTTIRNGRDVRIGMAGLAWHCRFAPMAGGDRRGEDQVSAEVKYRCEELPGKIVAVTLHSGLNDSAWDEIDQIGTEVVERLSKESAPRTLVDLSSLNHMGSALVALVVRVWKTVTEQKGEMVVVNQNEFVGEVLSIAGLANRWRIVPTRDQAIEELCPGASRLTNGQPATGSGRLSLLVGAVALAAGVLALLDLMMGGAAAEALGRPALLWATRGLAVLGVVAGAVAMRGLVGASRWAGLVIAILGAGLFAGTLLGDLNRLRGEDGLPGSPAPLEESVPEQA